MSIVLGWAGLAGWLLGLCVQIATIYLLRPSFFLSYPSQFGWMDEWMDGCMGTTKLTILITFGFLAL
jgi:hypothetical protein